MRSACRGFLGPLVLVIFAGSLLRIAAQAQRHDVDAHTGSRTGEICSPRIVSIA